MPEELPTRDRAQAEERMKERRKRDTLAQCREDRDPKTGQLLGWTAGRQFTQEDNYRREGE